MCAEHDFAVGGQLLRDLGDGDINVFTDHGGRGALRVDPRGCGALRFVDRGRGALPFVDGGCGGVTNHDHAPYTDPGGRNTPRG